MEKLCTDQINSIPMSIGVYRIYVKTNNKELSISRFCGKDLTGLLYIGRTTDQKLRQRIYQFYASSNSEMLTNNHSGGAKYLECEIIKQTLGKNHSLYFDFVEDNHPDYLEKQLLKEYKGLYGEYPPLNK